MKETWKIQREVHNEDVFYIVDWSPWGAMDRWVINRLVPSEAGLFQLWVKDSRNFGLLVTEPTYYGGLRNSLREVIDELAPSGGRLRKMIGGRECLFRFSTCASKDQLMELKDWFADGGGTDSDGREILVNEREDLRRFPAPPPDVQAADREELKDSDFGPKLPGKNGETIR